MSLVLLVCWAAVPGKTIVVPAAAPTISAALMKAQKGDTILVENGTYRENPAPPPGVTVLAKTPLQAVIDGGGRGITVTLANNSSIDGCEIRNGTIGVFSSSAGNAIRRCRVTANTQTGIMCVGHLPAIEDNWVVYNKGSGIQGWDLRSTMSSINHNTIAYNENHGLAIGGNSSIIAENNIIAFNGQFGLKTESAAAQVTLNGNNLFGNATPSALVASENIAQDPLFTDARRMDFTLAQNSPCAGAGTDKKDIGVRPRETAAGKQ